MKTDLEQLKELYPKLSWVQGRLHKSLNHPSPLYTEEESLNLLLDHYTGYSITEQGFMNNPENEVTREAGAMEYILANFKDLEEAFLTAPDMKQPKRQLVPRTHDMATKTKAQFFGQFRSAIRKIWLFSAIRREAVKRAKVAPNQYLCAHCNDRFKSNEIEVNHKHECGSLREFEDFSPFISAMFQEDLDALEILCKPCHKEFTFRKDK